MWYCQTCKETLRSPEGFGKHEAQKPECKRLRLASGFTGWQSVELDGIPVIVDRQDSLPKTEQQQQAFRTKWLEQA